MNIMLSFIGNLQQVPTYKKHNVGGLRWPSFLYVLWICMKLSEKWPQLQAVVSDMYVS